MNLENERQYAQLVGGNATSGSKQVAQAERLTIGTSIDQINQAIDSLMAEFQGFEDKLHPLFIAPIAADETNKGCNGRCGSGLRTSLDSIAERIFALALRIAEDRNNLDL